MLSSNSHGGIVFPLEAFRPKLLAAALAEGLITKARNITSARLRLTRHPEAALVLGTISGSIVDDPGAFWRENVDLAVYASQALPRQCFLYFVVPGPDRRQGFMVAQRGQVLAADEGTADNMPPDATEDEWPVARLAAQMRIGMDELRGGFAGGPSIEVSLLEPSGDDQALLMQLAGQPAEDAEPAEAEPSAAPAASTASGRPSVEQDQKRREAEKRAALEEREALALRARNELAYAIDELGIIVAPQAELGDADILAPFLVRELHGDPPAGVPGALTDQLQGKRIDFVVRIEFLSEVFTGAGPLTKAEFEAQAQTRELAGNAVGFMEVLAPRLSPGTLLRRGSNCVFISRRPDEPWPQDFLARLLGP